jgi:hypothetical protein
MRTRTPIGSLLAVLCLLGCATEVAVDHPELPEAADDVGVNSQAIINGIEANTEIKTRWGFVALAHTRDDGSLKFFCSATLYSNTWAVTAKHCLTHENTQFLQSQPGRLRVQMGRGVPGSQGSQTRTGKSIYFANTPSLDVALIEVTSPFTLPRNGDAVLSTTGFSRQFGWVNDGTQVICHGHGYNFVDCDGTSCNVSGAGTLRLAVLTADVVDATPLDFYRFPVNSQGQNLTWGDSGGGCIVAATWPPALVSISSSCFPGQECFADIAWDALWDSYTKVSP